MKRIISATCVAAICFSIFAIDKIDGVDTHELEVDTPLPIVEANTIKDDSTTATTVATTTTTTTKGITTTKKKKKIKKKKTLKRKGNVVEYQNYAHELVISYGWSEEDFTALVNLWNRESGWNPYARNKKSGACGIPQSLPCSKMKSEGSDYRTNYKAQIRWGLKYIKNRYGSPSGAWGHFKRKGWY